MKRLFSYLLFLILGFFGGLLTYELWPASVPSPDINGPLAVSICELNRDPEQYGGKLMHIKAIIHGSRGGNPYLVDESCGSQDNPESKMIAVYVEPNQAFSVLPQWSTYTSFCADDTYAAAVDGMAAEVILVGIYNSHESQIIPRSVVQLSAASKQR